MINGLTYSNITTVNSNALYIPVTPVNSIEPFAQSLNYQQQKQFQNNSQPQQYISDFSRQKETENKINKFVNSLSKEQLKMAKNIIESELNKYE